MRYTPCAFLVVLVFAAGPLHAQTAADAAPAPQSSGATGCLKCHAGIEGIRQEGSMMLAQILEQGQDLGDPAGCVVCHGGNPDGTDKNTAHGGTFYPDPGSPWINQQTCGKCHKEHVKIQWQSLMMTEAGKIQGTAWAFGALTGYEHRWGNYDVANPSDKTQRVGTDAYRAYMERLAKIEPQVFVQKHEALPDAPKNLDELPKAPRQAVFTYLRNQCLRCHFAVRGRAKRGDFRGMGCSGCHIPYSNEGLYEGADPSVPHDQPGHCLVHTIQASRDAKVVVHGHQYSGIPVETCTTCHNRGKRIGVSYQGLMESAYTSPFGHGGEGQPGLHTKHYLAMEQDVHYQKGMLCQDCHTTVDVHGDGFLAAANLGVVEIECSDCHGTPDAYPWELPLGYMDEFGSVPQRGPARGTTHNLLKHTLAGTVYPSQDGYLLTARGNPLTNAVRDGDRVIVHTAGGQDIELKPLKTIARDKQLSLRGQVAMQTVTNHMRKMECYTCHTAWAPQCYGCHVKVDYSGGKTSTDWLAGGRKHMRPECRADRGEIQYALMIPGQVTEQRSYMRYEDPPMGVNGEGRVTPIAPGCQVSVTVIGADGKPLLLNHIFRTPAGTEGGGKAGQLSLDMSPIQPHTMTKNARRCESCHLSGKALGYGINSGKSTRPYDKRVFVDLESADGHVLAEKAIPQIESITGLTDDWSRVVTEDGKQLQTVGHHFKGSRPLNNDERTHIARQGICLSCHQEIPDQSLAVNLLHHIAKYTGQTPKSAHQHSALVHKVLLLSGWTQVVAGLGVPLLIIGAGLVWIRRRRRRNHRV